MKIEEASKKICPYLTKDLIIHCATSACMAWEFDKVIQHNEENKVMFDENHKPIYNQIDSGYCKIMRLK